MQTRRLYLSLVLAAGVLLAFALLAALRPNLARAASPLPAASALPAGVVHYVAADHPACGGQAPCYTSIQAAVDAAAPGDEIRVAAGTYTGVHTRMAESRPFYQVVFITETLTLRGGYTLTNWTSPDSASNPTIIDAERAGRGVTIWRTNTPVTVTGFTITGGDYTGLGNPTGENIVCRGTGEDCGGGMLVRAARLYLANMRFYDNIATRTKTYSDGGGAYLWNLMPGSRIENSLFISNSVPVGGGSGGGAQITSGGDVTFSGCTFQDNRAAGEGGGLGMFQPGKLVVVEDTLFTGNSAGEVGGAIGGRMVASGLALRLDRSLLVGNSANQRGAAIYLYKQGSVESTFELANSIFAGNLLVTTSYEPAVITAVSTGAPYELSAAHLTIVDHPGMAAFGLTSSTNPVTGTITNTLISTAAGAIRGKENGPGELLIRHTNTLAFNLGALHLTEAGTPTFIETGSLAADPLLDSSYHLLPGSPAIDAGVPTTEQHDIDRDPRTMGLLPDIGADEYYVPPTFFIYIPALFR